jgi:hypothetical protein
LALDVELEAVLHLIVANGGHRLEFLKDSLLSM